ncbi:MAG TPA: AraC family transcriptional regulator [Thermoanaerobaculia bacterium]|nr:AraC family transcriptional regulator [Thermoanaerobaculia bacterium]
MRIERELDRSGRLRRLREYVHHHLEEAISLQCAARQVGLERTYFSSFFHRRTGCRFNTWLRLVKITRALELLDHDLSITELAHLVGYQDLTTFERAFKRTTGSTPSRMRRELRSSRNSIFAEKMSTDAETTPRRQSYSEPRTQKHLPKGEVMATGDDNKLQVRGSVDIEKYKSARERAGGKPRFELRAMKPVQAAQAEVSCIVCFVCFVCIVCVAANADRLGISDLPRLER